MNIRSFFYSHKGVQQKSDLSSFQGLSPGLLSRYMGVTFGSSHFYCVISNYAAELACLWLTVSCIKGLFLEADVRTRGE